MGVTPSDLAVVSVQCRAVRESRSSLLGHAEMGLEPYRIVGERGAVALIDDAAAVEDDGPIGKPQDLARLLLDHDRRQAFLADDVAEHAEQLLDDDRRQPSSGSSSRSSAGLVMSVRAIASICCSPPESWLPMLARRSARRGNRP